ncbi:MAG: hypothetical protein HFH45_04695 [Bacilli bacterium]|nr:hypothetical protein [Bacilli bacterium]
MRRIRKRKKQRKIIILSMVCLLCIMTSGYAAFQTNLNISAKGNILHKEININELKQLVVTTGNGLYEDPYEENRYIYRGAKPNNYIMFNDEVWRIIAIEPDNTLKIIKNEIVKEMKFDEDNHRSNEKNTYCIHPQYGCGVFTKINGIFKTPNNDHSGTVTEDSSIKEYLNGEYYNSLINSAKIQIQSHSYNIGAVANLRKNGNDTIQKNINGEKMYTWTGNIGLANVSDILKASINPLCTSATEAIIEEKSICNDSYFHISTNDNWWLINAYALDEGTAGYTYDTWYVTHYNGTSISGQFVSKGVRPALFLKSNITLTGNGTETNPYIIQE